MRKRFLSVVLTGAMVIGSSAMALAADKKYEGNDAVSIEASSQLKSPTINVTVNDPEAKITANPYGLKVQVNEKNVTDTLVGTSYKVTNSSDCNVSVGFTATIVADSGSKVKVATTADAAQKATAPTAFVQATVKNSDGQYAIYDAKTKKVTFGEKENAAAVVYAAKAATYTAPIVLEKKNAVDSKVAVATVELTGATGGAGWEAADTFKVTTVFNIAPSVSEANVSATATE